MAGRNGATANLARAFKDVIDEALAPVEADVAELKTDVAELKTDVAELKTDVAQLKTDSAQILELLTGAKTP